LTNNIADVFTDFLNEWHSYNEPYDDRLDAWLHELYAKAKRRRRKLDFSVPYFSPSSAGKCDRELYVKALGMPKDQDEVKPWQRRWTAQGTAIGDWFQRELLLAERHFEKFTGKEPPFRLARTEAGEPFFEDFVHTQRFFEHNGQRFSLLGTCDGVLEYGGKRIGLEIKSKQTSYSETGFSRMSSPKSEHVKQVTCYSLMYDLDEYLIVYVNTSKKAWFMDDSEFESSPDFRVFHVPVTGAMKTEILDKFAYVTKCVAEGTPPALDLDQFRFNNFKRSCALSLSDDEFNILKAQVRRALRGRLPEWKKQVYYDAFEYIREVRENADSSV
jgi:hypothetical protein